ncbi:hypothetical protein BJ742DRAFT_852829 [Cladochytrium replicatum]|nr:hypothetical protein BJ742DRAFT_852829 [Cladochytrium replicatum]
MPGKKWQLDLTTLDNSSKKHSTKIDPAGFSLNMYDRLRPVQSTSDSADSQEDPQAQLKLKKAWETALGPGKSVPMNAFMLYMSGNSVQIWSILITVMLLFNSIKGAIGVTPAFERFESSATGGKAKSFVAQITTDPLLLPKLAFVGLQLVNFALGLYKCSTMGLLPTAQSDWLAFLEPKTPLEYTLGVHG